MFRLNYKKNSAGFTLMEIVIVLALFAMVSVMISGIFVNLQTTQRRVRDNQELITDARYLMEVIAREIRSDSIDYTTFFNETSNPQREHLYLKSSDKTSIAIEHLSGLSNCGSSFGCVTISRGAGTPASLTSKTLAVEYIKYYITPTTDPFPDAVVATTPDEQPRVTIVLKVSNAPKYPRASELKYVYLQTTVTSRAYVR